MAEVQNTTTAPAVADPVATTLETAAIEPVAPATDADVTATDAVKSEVPATETAAVVPTTEEAKAEEAAAVVEAPVEPITEGQLGYKGPGLVKSLIPSKKEFWLNDAAVLPTQLQSYIRGEKAEVANPVVAWASQTGKGLLFFNKKGDTNHETPSSVLPLYEATDLKKEGSSEVAFKVHGHQHTLKATNAAERDGWYISLEKAIELGKAQKESVVESEGYKAELEKLSKPITSVGGRATPAAATGAAVAGTAATGAAVASAETTEATPVEEAKKDKKSRSTSRGVLGRFKAKKEEVEAKHEEKKEEKEEAKAAEEATEAAPVAGLDTTPAEAPIVAPVAVPAGEEVVPEPSAAATTESETPKLNKRNSIFGRLQSGWGSVKSPTKEKDAKDAELKPEVPAKDTAVSETAPQIPEATVTEPAADAPIAPAVLDASHPETETKPVETEAASPTAQKSGFLSGLFPKRNRSVSPSAALKDNTNEETTSPVSTVVTAPVTATETGVPAVDAAPVTTTETEAAPVTEETKATETANKRQSVLGSLGRRASKALNRMQAPKKENATPATETKAEETAASETVPTTETAAPVAETKPVADVEPHTIGDVVPEAVSAGEPHPTNVTAGTPVPATTVAASA